MEPDPGLRARVRNRKPAAKIHLRRFHPDLETQEQCSCDQGRRRGGQSPTDSDRRLSRPDCEIGSRTARMCQRKEKRPKRTAGIFARAPRAIEARHVLFACGRAGRSRRGTRRRGRAHSESRSAPRADSSCRHLPCGRRRPLPRGEPGSDSPAQAGTSRRPADRKAGELPRAASGAGSGWRERSVTRGLHRVGSPAPGLRRGGRSGWPEGC